MARKRRQSFTRGFPLVRIFGFEVRLDISWLLLGLLITWTLAAGLFPQSYPDLSTRTYWWMGVAGAIGILFSIVFHELSHSLVARRFGLPITGITLFIFGGIAEMREEPDSPKAEFLIAAAGPLSSVLLAGIFWQLELLAGSMNWPLPIVGVLSYLAFINLLLAIFNMVPAFPLDGGRLLRAALWSWRGSLESATRIGSQIGAGFGIFLMIMGVVAFVAGSFIGGMWYLLIGAFLRAAARGSYRQLLTRQFLQGRTVSDLMRRDPVTVPPSVGLRDFVEEYVYPHRRRMFPVVDGGELVGRIGVEDVKDVDDEDWERKTVGDVMRSVSGQDAVSPDTDGTELLRDMTQSGTRTRLVVEDGRLAGVVSLDELRELLSLRLELGQHEEDPGEPRKATT